ncbi:MAG: hypothetical protein WAN93_01445 [Solirubrobacteraceae bacterium]
MSARLPAAPAPDAVRVWRGFRAQAIDIPAFYERLSTVFVPATVLMQIDAGLDGYIPTVIAGLPGKPEEVPDETAILFWDSQQTYGDGFKKLAVRTYTLTHGAVYTQSSGAGFPLPFAGELQADQPYHLAARQEDWMHGSVRHLIGARPVDVDPGRFRAQIGEVFVAAQASELCGAIACAGNNYVVYWELQSNQPDGSAERFAALAERTAWSHTVASRPVTLDSGLWDDWSGMNIAPGDSLNLQFQRRWER